MDVFGAINRSWNTSKGALFAPFNVGTWLAFGFVSFLASLIDPSGGTGRLNLPGGGGGRPTTPTGPGAPPADFDELVRWLHEHADLLVTLGALALVTAIVVGLVFVWLGCRGLMIAYRSVALGHVAIGEGWRETRAPANALFWTYAIFSAVSFVLMVPLAILAFVRALALYEGGERDAGVYFTALAPHAVVLGVGALLGLLVGFVLRCFIAPYLLFFRCTAGEAWSRFFSVLRAHTGGVLLFVVARAILATVIGVLSAIVSTCTCCVGGLPVLHQTILAPVYFFDRAFTLHALASIDQEHALLAPSA